MTMYHSRRALVAEVRSHIENDDKFAVKTLVEIYRYQTEDEAVMEVTRHSNRVGFNHSDAKMLTRVAKDIVDKTSKLDADTMNIIHRRMPKYARQYVKNNIRSGKIVKEDGFYKWDYKRR